MSKDKNFIIYTLIFFSLVTTGILIYLHKIKTIGKMKPSEKYFNWLKNKEGLSLQPYIDDDFSTPDKTEYSIGHGHQIKDNESKLYDGITVAQANGLLINDLQNSIEAVDRLIFSKVSQGLYDALVDIFFNVGESKLKDSHLVSVVNATPSNITEIANQFRKWKMSGGHINNSLVTRREEEINFFV